MDYVAKANRYIKNVLSGKQLAGRFTRLACERQQKDLKKKCTKNFPYVFDKQKANRVCKFIECLDHVKGELAGEAIQLQDWQCFILTTIFGWVDKKTQKRRYTQAYIEVARGNGKSTLCSGIALYMMCADGELGADVYSFATTREQARIVFDDALAMARGNPDLKDAFDISCFNHSMVIIGTNSKFLPKSADAGTLDGLNTHCGIIDELHAHKTRYVYDVVVSSVIKRAQPLVFTITTAGFILDGICMERRRTAAHVLDESVTDDSLFGIIYTPDSGDDWTSEEAIIKANPNWKISVFPKQIKSDLTNALVNTSAQKNYLTKHLDIWVNSDSQWLDMEKYRKCVDLSLKIEDFQHEYSIFGLDLASKIDIAAVVKLFWKEIEGITHYYVFYDFYLPSETVSSSGNSQYEGWVKDGYLTITDGPITDLQAIEQEIVSECKQYDMLSLAFDPMQATQMSQNLISNGVPMVELFQNLKNYSEPMKQLQALIYAERIHFSDNPVMHWMMSNVVCHVDAKENIFPRKEKNEMKIDGPVALIMAMNQSIQLNVEKYYQKAQSQKMDWSKFNLGI